MKNVIYPFIKFMFMGLKEKRLEMIRNDSLDVSMLEFKFFFECSRVRREGPVGLVYWALMWAPWHSIPSRHFVIPVKKTIYVMKRD